MIVDIRHRASERADGQPLRAETLFYTAKAAVEKLNLIFDENRNFSYRKHSLFFCVSFISPVLWSSFILAYMRCFCFTFLFYNVLLFIPLELDTFVCASAQHMHDAAAVFVCGRKWKLTCNGNVWWLIVRHWRSVLCLFFVFGGVCVAGWLLFFICFVVFGTNIHIHFGFCVFADANGFLCKQ